MNINNVNDAIAIMERAKAANHTLDMATWQKQQVSRPIIKTWKELHECGTAACFAGLCAVSDEWRKNEGYSLSMHSGTPLIDLGGHGFLTGADAIGQWLDISEEESAYLCACSNEGFDLYHKDIEQITIDDVLEVLYRLRKTGAVSPNDEKATE